MDWEGTLHQLQIYTSISVNPWTMLNVNTRLIKWHVKLLMAMGLQASVSSQGLAGIYLWTSAQDVLLCWDESHPGSCSKDAKQK